MKVLNIINDALYQKLNIDISQDIKDIEKSSLGVEASWNLQVNDSIIKYFNVITYQNFKKLFYQFKNAQENQYKKLFKISFQFSNLFDETEYYNLLINEPDLNFFLMQYLTPHQKLPDLHTIKRYSNILKQLFEGIITNKSDNSIDSIFENTNFFNYYREVLKSEIVKHFFSSENQNIEENESKSSKYISYENYLKILDHSFIKNYLVFLILPKGVKAFTNRYLHIFINTEGFSYTSNEEEDKTKVNKFLLYF